MKLLNCLCIFIAFSFTGKAQSSRDSVMITINQLFAAMKNADTVLLKDCFSHNAVLQTIRDINGSVSVITEDVTDFIKFVGKETPGAADEKIAVETVKTDGPLAVAWIPYQFYYKGKFSHCGVNAFQLVRLNAVWKIQYLIDTRRKEGCQ
jgi:hypothetical protein